MPVVTERMHVGVVRSAKTNYGFGKMKLHYTLQEKC